MKARRQSEILSIIQENDIETQDQLLEELQARGLKSTQATISRDIKELHLIKELTGQGTYRYAVSERKTSLNMASRLHNIFKESVTSFEAAQNIVVIKTMPGLASAACSALDGMSIPGMVGSLAGDDTGLLIMRATEDAKDLCQEIQRMLEKG
ncbi:MAG: arginine repressor [Evtepia sp.]|jgi:transcriptional regulator of arginine metabolism|nr:arginine repressor [Evtepia sp.]